MKKIGILTGGADCPGLNSVIRAVVVKSVQEGYVVTGVKNGWSGLVDNDMKVLDMRLTSGILDRGGTILGTSRYIPPLDKEKEKVIVENFKRSGMDALIAVGGEDTLKIALELYEKYNLPIVGVPKSIDNELSGTEYTFGFDTAVNIGTECIDRLHTTAESHHRIIVIEVMGSHSGWIAVQSGIAGGADIILVPEIPIDIEKVCKILRTRHQRGKTFSIIVVSEGARVEGYSFQEDGDIDKRKALLGNVGEFLADLIEDKTGYETRVSVLGHIQRGGTPTAFDRVLGTRFGFKAVEFVQKQDFGKMVSLHSNKIKSIEIAKAIKKRKAIEDDLYEIVKAFGN